VKSLPEQMGVYAAYHRNPVNKVVHFIFVPAIVWSLMLLADLVPLLTLGGVAITLAFPITAAILIWYLRLDFALGVASTVLFTVLLVTAITVNVRLASTSSSLLLFAAVFIGSFAAQFVGHGVWEKRRPALMDNLFQVLVAPIFVVAETAFAWGFRRKLREAVEVEMQNHLPRAAA
jgi:2-hydroxy fatty acid dioxygenase